MRRRERGGGKVTLSSHFFSGSASAVSLFPFRPGTSEMRRSNVQGQSRRIGRVE